MEGFIPQDEDHIMEDMAKDYLDELINRSLIQVEKRYWGRIATRRVHDLLRDIAVEKAKVLNILYIYDEVKHSNIIISSCPRQPISSGTEKSLWLREYSLSSIDSLSSLITPLFLSSVTITHLFLSSLLSFIFNVRERKLLTECWNKKTWMAEATRRQRQLLQRQLLDRLYLGLRGAQLNISASLILNLRRLQILDIYSVDWHVKLPVEICKLQELRHVIGSFRDGPLPIENLTKLQTLKYVKNESWTEIKTEKLINLVELWLHGYLKEQVLSLDSMANLKSLRILSVELDDDKSFVSLQPLCNCPQLIDLRLRGKMKKLPEDIHEILLNLECLYLGVSRLEDNPMPLLEKLPNLLILYLDYEFNCGKKLICSAKGFLRHEILPLDVDDDLLKEWQVEEGALPRLRCLRIDPNNSKLIMPEILRTAWDFLIEKAFFLQGVRNEVKWLKDAPGWMQCFLKDAEEKQYSDALISKWVSDIKEFAYDIEDVLDTFHLNVHSQDDDDEIQS
ncbi:hypothetical protein Ddye_023186 [Dipteronia dyeriana]|uniref:Uncharacterized protein n=1 Tax=Dipteronia dyeriana TaxID=168575 RepID=A0AAD9TTG7_9ROSI|nr:hypothetical protein Ddye_023186 [Dipteronia dyeriana]